MMKDTHMYIPSPFGFVTAAVGAIIGSIISRDVISSMLMTADMTTEAAQHVPLLFQIGGGAIAVVLLFLGLRAQWRADDARDALALEKQLVQWKEAMEMRMHRVEGQIDTHLQQPHDCRRRIYDKRYADEDTKP